MAIQAIIFDIDKTIMNGKPFSYYLETELGVKPEDSEPFFQDILEHCIIGKKDLKKELIPYLKKWNWDQSVDEFLLYWFDSENVIDHLILSHIRELRKKKLICVLATNQEKYKTEYIVERMYFKDKFDHIFSSAHIGVRKPDKRFFSHIDEILQLPKETVIFWDYKQDHVDAAAAFGFQAFLYENFKSYQKHMKKILTKK